MFGALLSFMGVFNMGDAPVIQRTLYLVAANWVGASLDAATYYLVLRRGWGGKQFGWRVVISAAAVALPLGLLLWLSTGLFGRNFTWVALPTFWLSTFLVSAAFIGTVVAPCVDGAIRRAELEARAQADAAQVDPVPTIQTRDSHPRLMDRLPRHLRGNELWALKTEDHYLLVITSKGEALLRLRMSDALRELGSIEGAQTHRSWWIARSAFRGVRKGDRISLLLPDGARCQ